MPARESDALFTPAKLGSLTLKNRIVYPAMTRARCADRLVGPENIKYYSQRSSAGLIITEPSSVSPQANGFVDAPGMYTRAHMAAWSKLTKALHEEGCTAVAQLWHTGRMSHSSFNDGAPIVAPSAISASERSAAVPACGVMGADGAWHSQHETPRALSTAEVEAIVEDFGRAAALAVEAGFDGVEIHAASGYLLDTFLQACSNTRTDKYGGDADGRFSLLSEVVTRVAAELPAAAIGVKLSPNSGFNGMGSASNADDFLRYAAQLRQLGVGYLHVQDGVGTNGAAASWFGKVTTSGFHQLCAPVSAAQLGAAFGGGGLIGNGGYTAESAAAAVARGDVTAVSFGRHYMANPDLAERIRDGRALAPLPPREAWFDPTHRTRAEPSWGYTDLATLAPGMKRARGDADAPPSALPSADASEPSTSDAPSSPSSASDGD